MTNTDDSTNKDDDFNLGNTSGHFKSLVNSIKCSTKSIIITFNPSLMKEDINLTILPKWNDMKVNLKRELEKLGLRDEIILNEFYRILNLNHYKIVKRIGLIEKEEKKETKGKDIIKTYKVTKNKTLYESVVVGGDVFLAFNDNGKLSLIPEIEEHQGEEKKVIKPMDKDRYASNAYIFRDKEELEKYAAAIIEKKVTIDTIFKKIRLLVAKFIVHDGYVLDYLVALNIISYFQDLFATVPYTMFVSDNGNGKSAIGNFIELLAYRPVSMTDPTVANIFRVFGTLEAGQCTLILDEAEKIDKDKDMMSILKTGYENGKKVQRINQNGDQEHFHTFGLKVMLAERAPNPITAKGVLDRIFKFSNYIGRPELDIKEVKIVRNPNFIKIREYFESLRKLLLAYRIMNYHKPIVDIQTRLDGRNNELCKPILQVFYNTELQERIENVLEIILNEKQKSKENSLEKIVLDSVIILFDKYPDGNLPFNEIWDLVIEKSNGERDFFKNNEYHTERYGTIYKKTISKILRDKFGAKDSERRSAKISYVYFEDREKIERFLDEYKQKDVKIKCSEKSEPNECNEYDIEDLL